MVRRQRCRANPSSSLEHDDRTQCRQQERFGTKVDLRYRQGKGALQVHYYSDDDLERVLQIMGVELD